MRLNVSCRINLCDVRVIVRLPGILCWSMPPVDAVLLIFVLLLGLVFGSFLNVCIVRLPQGASVVAPASRCVGCHHPVRKRDNIPVLSWILLRGRCRDCGTRISIRYPLVEVLTAILFILCLLSFGMGFTAVSMAVFCWLLLGLLWMDAETFLLPDAFTLPGIVLGLIYSAAASDSVLRGLERALLGGVAVAGFLWLVSAVYRLVRRRDGMGFGDVKLGAMLGVWLGWEMGSVCLFLAIVAGAVGGLLIAGLRQAKAPDAHAVFADAHIPFGTFLAAAGLLTVFAGAPLLRWYLAFFPR